MCPAGLKLAQTLRHLKLIDRTTVGANELFTVPPNPNRVAFLLATGGAAINYRPTEFGTGVIHGVFIPAAINPIPELNVEHYGDLIFQSWDFVLVTLGNTYQVWEVLTGAEWK